MSHNLNSVKEVIQGNIWKGLLGDIKGLRASRLTT